MAGISELCRRIVLTKSPAAWALVGLAVMVEKERWRGKGMNRRGRFPDLVVTDLYKGVH